MRLTWHLELGLSPSKDLPNSDILSFSTVTMISDPLPILDANPPLSYFKGALYEYDPVKKEMKTVSSILFISYNLI